jgi:hypothetical protein
METTAIQSQGGMDLATFRNLPSIINTFDEYERRAFAQGLAEKLLGREITDSEVETVIEVVIDLAINYLPIDAVEVSLRQR